MVQISYKQAGDRFDTLPDNLKEIGFTAHSTQIVEQACSQNHLSEDKQVIVKRLVGYTLFGFIHPEDLSREIREALVVNSAISDAIASEINRKLFTPIKNDLAKVYAPVPGSIVSPTSQVAPENIIDLKTTLPPAAIKPEAPIAASTQALAAPKAPAAIPMIGATKEGIAEKPIQVIPPSKLEEQAKEHEAPFILHKEEAEIKPTAPPPPEKRSLGGLFWFLGGKGKGEKEEIKAEVELLKPQAGMKPEPIKLVSTPATAPKIVHYTEAKPAPSPFGATQVKPLGPREVRPIEIEKAPTVTLIAPKTTTLETPIEKPKEVSIPIISKAAPPAPPKAPPPPPPAPPKLESKAAELLVIRKDFKAEPLPVVVKPPEPLIVAPKPPLPQPTPLPEKKEIKPVVSRIEPPVVSRVEPEEKPNTIDLSVFKNLPEYGVRPQLKEESKKPEPIIHPAPPRIEPETFKSKEPPREVREIIKETPKPATEIKKIEELRKPEERPAKPETPVINIYITPEAVKKAEATQGKPFEVAQGKPTASSIPAPAASQPPVVERVIERIIEKTTAPQPKPPKKYSFEGLPPGTFVAPAPPPPPQKPKPTSANFPESKRPHDDNVIDLRTFEIKKEGNAG